MYHADFVTGQPIKNGDTTIAFLLERTTTRPPDEMPLAPSHDYRVASLPLPGLFREGGELEPTEGFEVTYTRQALQHARQSTSENLMELAKGKLAIAFLSTSTFHLLLELVKRQNIFECLDDAVALHTRMADWLALPKAAEFFELQTQLKADTLAYFDVLSAAKSMDDIQSHPVTQRLENAKRVMGPGVYDRYHDIYHVFYYFNGPRRVFDPVTGEKFSVPVPWNTFSGGQVNQSASDLLSEGISKVADRALLLKPLLQIKQLDAALTLLGRFWAPSMYLGDWCCDEAHAFYLANLSEKATRSE
jgi:hypothetical protein